MDLKALLADVLQLSEAAIADDLAMENVEAWDSLRHMELIVALEQAYRLELSFDEIVSMRTVAQIRKVLGAHGVPG